MYSEAIWGPESTYETHGISHLRSVAPGIMGTKLALKAGIPPPYKQTFWARIRPGGFIIPHIDAGPYQDRWHIPVETGGWFWEDGEYAERTEPFRVRHWLPHAVFNDSDRDRIHLIVDRDVIPDDAPDYMPLQKTEMIPEIAAMIDAL